METKNEAKKFNTEILENVIASGGVNSQENIFSDKKDDTISETLEQHTDEIRSKDSGVSKEETGENKEPAQQTNESSKNAETQKATEKSEEVIKKKDGRGRPALSEAEKLERANKRFNGEQTNTAGSKSDPAIKEPKLKDAKTSLINDLDKYKNITQSQSAAQANGTAAPAQIDLSKYISGALLLICLDSIMPGLILKIASWVDPKYKRVKASKLKMNKEEREELEPLADEMVKLLFGFVHPAIAFLIASGVIYAGKLFSLEDSDFTPIKLAVVPDRKINFKKPDQTEKK